MSEIIKTIANSETQDNKISHSELIHLLKSKNHEQINALAHELNQPEQQEQILQILDQSIITGFNSIVDKIMHFQGSLKDGSISHDELVLFQWGLKTSWKQYIDNTQQYDQESLEDTVAKVTNYNHGIPIRINNTQLIQGYRFLGISYRDLELINIDKINIGDSNDLSTKIIINKIQSNEGAKLHTLKQWINNPNGIGTKIYQELLLTSGDMYGVKLQELNRLKQLGFLNLDVARYEAFITHTTAGIQQLNAIMTQGDHEIGEFKASIKDKSKNYSHFGYLTAVDSIKSRTLQAYALQLKDMDMTWINTVRSIQLEQNYGLPSWSDFPDFPHQTYSPFTQTKCDFRNTGGNESIMIDGFGEYLGDAWKEFVMDCDKHPNRAAGTLAGMIAGGACAFLATASGNPLIIGVAFEGGRRLTQGVVSGAVSYMLDGDIHKSNDEAMMGRGLQDASGRLVDGKHLTMDALGSVASGALTFGIANRLSAVLPEFKFLGELGKKVNGVFKYGAEELVIENFVAEVPVEIVKQYIDGGIQGATAFLNQQFDPKYLAQNIIQTAAYGALMKPAQSTIYGLYQAGKIPVDIATSVVDQMGSNYALYQQHMSDLQGLFTRHALVLQPIAAGGYHITNQQGVRVDLPNSGQFAQQAGKILGQIQEDVKEGYKFYMTGTGEGGIKSSSIGKKAEQISQNKIKGNIKQAENELQLKGITKDQRKGYIVGVSERLFNTINPRGYDIKEKVKEFIGGNKNREIDSAPRMDDARRLYLGLPQKNNTFGISPYKPKNSKNKNQIYFKPKFDANVLVEYKRTKDNLRININALIQQFNWKTLGQQVEYKFDIDKILSRDSEEVNRFLKIFDLFFDQFKFIAKTENQYYGGKKGEYFILKKNIEDSIKSLVKNGPFFDKEPYNDEISIANGTRYGIRYDTKNIDQKTGEQKEDYLRLIAQFFDEWGIITYLKTGKITAEDSGYHNGQSTHQIDLGDRGIMGGYTITEGYDDELGLKYISYYDKFDFHPPGIPKRGSNLLPGKPLEIYGRIYFDKNGNIIDPNHKTPLLKRKNLSEQDYYNIYLNSSLPQGFSIKNNNNANEIKISPRAGKMMNLLGKYILKNSQSPNYKIGPVSQKLLDRAELITKLSEGVNEIDQKGFNRLEQVFTGGNIRVTKKVFLKLKKYINGLEGVKVTRNNTDVLLTFDNVFNNFISTISNKINEIIKIEEKFLIENSKAIFENFYKNGLFLSNSHTKKEQSSQHSREQVRQNSSVDDNTRINNIITHLNEGLATDNKISSLTDQQQSLLLAAHNYNPDKSQVFEYDLRVLVTKTEIAMGKYLIDPTTNQVKTDADGNLIANPEFDANKPWISNRQAKDLVRRGDLGSIEITNNLSIFEQISEDIGIAKENNELFINELYNSLGSEIEYISSENGLYHYLKEIASKHEFKNIIDNLDLLSKALFIKKDIIELSKDNDKHQEFQKKIEKLEDIYTNKVEYEQTVQFICEHPTCRDHIDVIKFKFPNGLQEQNFIDSGFNGIVLQNMDTNTVIKLNIKKENKTKRKAEKNREDLSQIIYQQGIKEIQEDTGDFYQFKTPKIYDIGDKYFEMEKIQGKNLDRLYKEYVLIRGGFLNKQNVDLTSQQDLNILYFKQFGSTNPSISDIISEMYPNHQHGVAFELLINEMRERGIIHKDLSLVEFGEGKNKKNPKNIMISSTNGNLLDGDNISFTIIDFGSVTITNTEDYNYKSSYDTLLKENTF